MKNLKTLQPIYEEEYKENNNFYLIYVEGQTEENYLNLFLNWLNQNKKYNKNIKVQIYILKNKNILDSKNNDKAAIEKEISRVVRRFGVSREDILKISKILLDVDRNEKKLNLWRKLLKDEKLSLLAKNIFLSNPDFELFLLMHMEFENFKKTLNDIEANKDNRKYTKKLFKKWIYKKNVIDNTSSYRRFLNSRNIDEYFKVRNNYLKNQQLLTNSYNNFSINKSFSNVENLLNFFIESSGIYK